MEISDKSIVKATKWSLLGEIIVKFASPVSSMILARILAPAVYGVIASISMILTFCELFADAGFNKYIVQREVESEDELNKVVSVAFWTNLVLTLLIWLLIAIFATPIASLVGCAGMELAVIVSCSNLPLHGFSSIQSAKLKRNMDFKTISFARISTLVVPFAVTIPVAIATKSYWAIIVGTIASSVLNVVVMSVKLRWCPPLYFNFKKLKEMFSFSMWSMLESFFVWLINWGDVFIVTQLLTQEYLGIYKTSMNMVGQITGIVSASITPVLLSSLSKVQNDNDKFRELFYNFSAITGVIIIPMGVGMFIYRDLMCSIALGEAWMAGATLMGIWGLINCIALLFNSFNGCILISKGRPKISVLIQIVQIACILPVVYFTAQMDFEILSYSRALVRIIGMVVYSIVVWAMYRISAVTTILKLVPTLVATAVMAVVGIIFVSLEWGKLFSLASVFVCVAVYFGVLVLFPSVRKNILPNVRNLLRKKSNS